MATASKLRHGQWVRHAQFGVGQVTDDAPGTRVWQTTVFFPVRPENPNGKPKKRRVLTSELKQIEKPS